MVEGGNDWHMQIAGFSCVFFFVMYLVAFLASSATPGLMVPIGMIVGVVCLLGFLQFKPIDGNLLVAALVLQYSFFFYFSLWAASVSNKDDGGEVLLFAFGAIMGLLYNVVVFFVVVKFSELKKGRPLDARAAVAISSSGNPNQINKTSMLTTEVKDGDDVGLNDY